MTDELVVLETMPAYLRETCEAGGYSPYPWGASRYAMPRSEAQAIVGADPKWSFIASDVVRNMDPSKYIDDVDGRLARVDIWGAC